MESWIYGIIFTLIAAFGSTTGLILQKIAHGVEQANEEKGIPQKNWNGIPCNKYFLCGFLFLGVFPIPFEFLALMYAGQSLILPTGTGCTVIFGQRNKEKVSSRAENFIDVRRCYRSSKKEPIKMECIQIKKLDERFREWKIS